MKSLPCTLLLVLFISFTARSQNLPVNHIQAALGYSSHGSGDLKGIAFSADLTRHIKKRLSIGVTIGSTIHDGSIPLYFTGPGNEEIDGSIRYTVAGLQLVVNGGIDIVRDENNELILKAGPMFRYQSSGLPDQYEIAYPAATGLPYPVIIYSHSTPQRTYSVGGALQLQYNYMIGQRWSLGIMSGFQVDSNGDNIFQAGVTTGIRF